MIRTTLRIVGVAVLGASFAMGAVAADKGDKNKSGMYESGDRGFKGPSSGGNDAQHRTPAAGSGVSTLPSTNNPSSVSESAPQKTGKAAPAKKVNDDKRMPNLKSPSSVSESAPDKTNKGNR